MDQGQIVSALQNSIQPEGGSDRTEDLNRAESHIVTVHESCSDDEECDTVDAGNEFDNNYSSCVDPLAELKLCSEYQTLVNENFSAEVVLASLIKLGGGGNLQELTDWCFDRQSDTDIEDILASYCQEHWHRTSGPFFGPQKQASEMPPPPPPPSSSTLPPRMETQFIIPAGGRALLLSQQFAAVWGQFLAEVESVAGGGPADHLSFRVLAAGLEGLAAQVEPLNRKFFSQFPTGSPNLVSIRHRRRIKIEEKALAVLPWMIFNNRI